ncbi:MAG: hypothetical protein KA479_03335 [Saprospiraceae bacterium]|nr:hypothetical protein [Saprospiraceae bacterium]
MYKALPFLVCVSITCFFSIRGTAQSCFPVNSYWEGRFFAFTGQGDWHLTFGADVQINGLTCQPADFWQLQDPPMPFQNTGVYYYHNDGTYMYQLDTQTLALNPLYPLLPAPGDTLLQPVEWTWFGQEFHRWVLDTFTIALGGEDYFAYRVVNQCKWETDEAFDTITIAPALGIFPYFGHERPHLNIPDCSLFDGTRYQLSCAKIPGASIYGDSVLCAHLVSTYQFLQNQEIRIVPNPVHNDIRLLGLNPGHILRHRILGISGQVIHLADYWPTNCGLDVRHLPAGSYWLELYLVNEGKKVMMFQKI